MEELYVCYSYYHVLVTILKILNNRTIGINDIIITDQIPNVDILYKKLIESSLFKDVRLINDQYRSIEFFHKKSIIYKINFVMNYKKYISKMYEDVQIKNKKITLYFDRQHLSQYFILNYRDITLSEDGRHSPAAFIFKKSKFRLILEKLRLIVKLGGYPDTISTIECSSENMLPNSLKKKFRKIDFKALYQNLSINDKELLRNIFSFNNCYSCEHSCVILTQPFFKDGFLKSEEEQLSIYKQIYEDLKFEYKPIFIKPHPRDELNYSVISADINILDKNMPFELFNILGVEFKKYITINSTSIAGIDPEKLIILGIGYNSILERNMNRYI